ncbi:DoxX family protein [Vibrio amylolyticus]|uniref:DoxX family protein n=1 Tax=Vibrio amylolyticus TaxID=2847292 RepID=UPI00354FE103
MNTQQFSKLFTSNSGFAPLFLRLPLGIILMAHGSQKLFGWLGGYGLEGTGQWMESIGYAPGYLMALLAGSAEFFGGFALLVGLLTRPAALVTAFTMFMAMLVHIDNGLFVSNNGYEFALLLVASTFYLAFSGAGSVSVDSAISAKLKGENDFNGSLSKA